MKFSKRSVKLQSLASYIGFRSTARTSINHEIRAREVERARLSGSFTWTPLDELIELADIPEIFMILEMASM